jgi:rhomboid protease GluP
MGSQAIYPRLTVGTRDWGNQLGALCSIVHWSGLSEQVLPVPYVEYGGGRKAVLSVIIELQRSGHIQRMVYEEFENRVRDGEIPPEVLVRFEAVTGDEFVPAGKLELYGELVDPGRRAFRDQFRRRGLPLVTAILVGIQIRIYLLSWVPGAEDLLQLDFTNWAPGILEKAEVYRLLSYGVLHIGFTHLLFNLTFLAYTGYNLERAMGRWNLLVLYFGSVFCGGVLSMWMAPDRPSLGASGGDFGLLAAAVVFGWKHWDDIPPSARTKFGWALVPYLGFSLISGLSSENVDNWGHLGGLFGGAVLMTMLFPEISAGVAKRNRIVRWSSVATGVAVSAVLAIFGPQLIELEPRTEGSWTVPVPGYWREGWTFTGDRGWFSPTGDASMVVARTLHDRPISADGAAEQLVARIGSGATDTRVVERSQVELVGLQGVALTLAFTIADEPQVVWAVVVTRGVVTYRALLQSKFDAMDRYRPILQRALEHAVLGESEALVKARLRAATHPRSWQPAIELGDALYRAGHPHRALIAYEKALARVPDRTEALVGRLRVFTHYGLIGGLGVAREMLESGTDDARVIVAIADLLDEVGAEKEATAALEQAWITLPGNGILRRARLRRGLPVEG